jgi:hypothetical protein
MFMHNRTRNHPNALKHGVFAKMTILPWEDPQEFSNLWAMLVEEWKPVGPTEQDAVLSIAKGIWRKRRMQRFLPREMQRCRLDPDHPAYDVVDALRACSEAIKENPDQFYRYAFNALRAGDADHLLQKFPRQNYKSTLEWGRAIQEEVTSVLLPAAEYGNSTEVLVARDALFFSQEVVKNELAVDERIDAMIDRAVKRLVQAKAMKQIMGTTSANGGTDQPKKLPSNKPDRSARIVTKNQNGRRSDSTQGAAETQRAGPRSS